MFYTLMSQKPNVPAPKRTPKHPPARPLTRSPRGRARGRKPRTLMKVAPGDGLRSWVTLQLPAWVLVIFAALLLMGLLAVLSSPDLSARWSVLLLELGKWLQRPKTP
jgi:hypothetical protein